ncbi:aminopeptidase P N-terminal domain-containing protein [Altererythrobacter sp. MF3-039]|uniref:aminopeptidase P N-terminal domain-containing protein n=1 Tax=Altererythrobacter sp. MF3-039 TaxID=3252901 RepID=UPI00390C77F4
MLDRRKLLGGMASVASMPLFSGTGAWAQDLSGPAKFASPSRTFPFTPEVYRERRAKLMEQMGGGVAVLHGARALAEGRLDPLTSQDNDFSYLTGLQDEAGAALLLVPGKERGPREFLFLAARDIAMERWEGARLADGSELERRTGFERVLRSGSLGGFTTSHAARHPEMHFLGPVVSPGSPVPQSLKLYGDIASRVPGTRVSNSATLIRDMRVAKEAREIALIRKAIAATEAGLNAAMRAVRPGMSERELKAFIENAFRANGADGLGFSSITATGRATAVLHYTGNDGVIQDGDMVLCDVGANVGGYSADITRTFPANGRFTDEQRNVYNTVLDAQTAAVATLRAGSYYSSAQDAAEAVIDASGHGDAFWHGLGHFIGLHVHDVGDLQDPLPENATLTVEPGIYLPDRSFGVRIEDDYRITSGGAEHMSNGVPRTVEAIEAAMNE